MAKPERLDSHSVLPFLPQEPGLRAHLFRVGALASRAAAFAGYSEQEIQNVGWAGLLHHTPMDGADHAVPAKLLTDLGLQVSGALVPLPERASAIVRAFRRADPEASPAIIDAASLVESANLFDEQIENLPYEDLSTERAVKELVQSGLLAGHFVKAIASFRVVSREEISGLLTRLTPVFPTQAFVSDRAEIERALRPCFESSESKALWEHSLDVAGQVSLVSGESAYLDRTQGFLAGLVHDIGRLALEQSNVAKELGAWRDLGFPVTYAEFLVSGTDHAALGAELLRAWGYPGPVIEAVEFHHRPELTGSHLAAAIYAYEDFDELMPSCARDHLAAKRIDITAVRHLEAGG